MTATTEPVEATEQAPPDLDPTPWIDHRLDGLDPEVLLCRSGRRHLFPDHVFNDEVLTVNHAYAPITFRRTWTCDRCGTMKSVVINAIVWEKVSHPYYVRPPDRDYGHFEGGIHPAALRRAYFLTTNSSLGRPVPRSQRRGLTATIADDEE